VLLPARLKTSHVTVAAAWKTYGVRPWRAETFKFSTDPELVAKVTDVIGLYLNPPENAIVLCVDEKSQIQALNRTQKVLPMQPGHAEQRTHDYVRHGTTTLFAALEVATGQVTGICKTRHRHQEFLGFLKHLARAYPERDGTQLHLVMDNYATHKHPEVNAWLAANPRFQVHFTLTSGSWLNLVEVWFGIIDRQAIRWGTRRRVRMPPWAGDWPFPSITRIPRSTGKDRFPGLRGGLNVEHRLNDPTGDGPKSHARSGRSCDRCRRPSGSVRDRWPERPNRVIDKPVVPATAAGSVRGPLDEGITA